MLLSRTYTRAGGAVGGRERILFAKTENLFHLTIYSVRVLLYKYTFDLSYLGLLIFLLLVQYCISEVLLGQKTTGIT